MATDDGMAHIHRSAHSFERVDGMADLQDAGPIFEDLTSLSTNKTADECAISQHHRLDSVSATAGQAHNASCRKPLP